MKYFTIKELTKSATADTNGIDNTPSNQEIDNLTKLVDNILDPLREAYGKPIRVNSGYRCKELNSLVGGKPTSQHLTGQAADISSYRNTKAENEILFNLVRKLHLPFDQLINEKDFSWIHVSYSDRNRRQVLWQ